MLRCLRGKRIIFKSKQTKPWLLLLLLWIAKSTDQMNWSDFGPMHLA